MHIRGCRVPVSALFVSLLLARAVGGDEHITTSLERILDGDTPGAALTTLPWRKLLRPESSTAATSWEASREASSGGRLTSRMLSESNANSSPAPAPAPAKTFSPVPVTTPVSLPALPPAPTPAYCSQHMCNAWWIGFLCGTFLLCLCIYLATAGRPFAMLLGRVRHHPGIRPFAGVATSRSNCMTRPVPVRHPGLGKHAAWECPVCMEEVTEGPQWTIFPCEHGSCNGCYQKLLSSSPLCPLCRIKLTEPDPEKAKAWRQISMDGSIPNRSSRTRDMVAAAGLGEDVPHHIVVVPLQDDCAEERLATAAAAQAQPSPSVESPSSSSSHVAPSPAAAGPSAEAPVAVEQRHEAPARHPRSTPRSS